MQIYGYVYIRILNNAHEYGYVFIRKQTDPDWDGTATDQTSTHRLLIIEKVLYLFYYNYLYINYKSTFFAMKLNND